MKILIFGPQGSGKGTQAELIARRRSYPYISTGDIFRYNIKNQTELGKKVEEVIKQGNLVSDELTNKIVLDRINQPDCERGFVLDGYPRNTKQAEYLDTVAKIDLAIVIELSDEQAVSRLSQRLACKCGLSYHTQFNPPAVEGRCDKCDGELYRRDDDQPEAIKKRLDIYHNETEKVFPYYEQHDILHRIDGAQSIEEVYNQIEKIIEQSSNE